QGNEAAGSRSRSQQRDYRVLQERAARDTPSRSRRIHGWFLSGNAIPAAMSFPRAGVPVTSISVSSTLGIGRGQRRLAYTDFVATGEDQVQGLAIRAHPLTGKP